MTESGQKIRVSVDGSWNILKFDEIIEPDSNIVSEKRTRLDEFQAPISGKYPLTVEQNTTVENLLNSFLRDEAQLLVNTEVFKDIIDKLKENNKLAEKIKDRPAQNKLTKQIKITKLSVKKHTEAYRKSSKLIADANRLLAGKVENIEEHIAKLIQITESSLLADSDMSRIIKKENQNNNNIVNSEQVIRDDIKIRNSKPVNSYPKSFTVNNAKYPRDRYDCEIIFDGYDDVLGSNKKEVRTEFLFGHSQKRMKSYFKSDDFIKCDAYVSKVDKKHYITLNIRVKSKDAKSTYGMLVANEPMRVEMIDGSKVYCTNRIQDGGKIEPYTGNILYTGIFEIEKDDLSTLKNNFMDNIGLIWSSGYEQYNIFNVDFLKNQLQCLEK